MMFTALALMLLFSFCDAGCKVNEIKVMDDFDMSKMMGKWYETHWQPPYFEKPEEVWYDYVEIWSPSKADKVSVRAHGRPINKTDCDSFPKSYRKTEGQPSAKWWTPRYINSSYSFPMDTWIIDTNYNSFCLMYGCTQKDNNGECKLSHAWVWSRTQELNDNDYNRVKELLPKLCIAEDSIRKMPIGTECEAIRDSGCITQGNLIITAFTLILWQLLIL